MNEITGKLTKLTIQKQNISAYQRLWGYINPNKLDSSQSPHDPLANAVLDSLQEQIAVIDTTGSVQFVNAGWNDFARNNNCEIEEDWVGVNYLDVCRTAKDKGDDIGAQTYEGIKTVLYSQADTFSIEYPCHSPTQKRWFMMTVAGLPNVKQHLYSICHRDITQRKLSELKAEDLARTDELTGLPNRRQFNEFLETEWKRSKRHRSVLTLMLLDLDHFKELNDMFGHPAGDDRLKAVGQVLKTHTLRAGDICARLGGDEFVAIFESLTVEDAKRIGLQILQMIKSLKVENPDNKSHPAFTSSIGIIRHTPTQECSLSKFIEMADQNLYKAKKDGGDTFRLTDFSDE